MIWEAPENDGNSHIQAYKVDWFTPGTFYDYCKSLISHFILIALFQNNNIYNNIYTLLR